LEEKISCQALCDKYHALHKQTYEWFEIDFDYFGRTTTPQQTAIAQDIYHRLNDNGHVFEDTVNQLYCQNHNAFLADRFVEGICPLCSYEDARGDQCDKCGHLLNAIDLIKPRCKICKIDGAAPIIRSSKHLFLNLTDQQPVLEAWFRKASQEGFWTSNSEAITSSWLKEGLKPRCITRDLKWGTKIPRDGYDNKVFYVWYDAPIGYPSITANYTSEWEKWWKNPEDVKLYQFMGKDNVPFHTVIFPSCLLGTKEPWTLLHHLSTTGFVADLY
jgi:methionyl-tRNA synthetase